MTVAVDERDDDGIDAVAVVVGACSRTPEPAQFAGPTMGTTYHVTVSGADSLQERRAVQSAIDRVLVESERSSVHEGAPL